MQLLNILLSIVGGFAVLVCVIRLIQGSENKARLALRFGGSVLLIVGYMLLHKLGLRGIPYIGPVVEVLAYVSVCIILFSIWWAEIADTVLGVFITGPGGGAVENSAQLSRAEALRKTGRYEEALDVVQEQLARHKNDFDCFMMMATIQAEDLNNLPMAASQIDTLIHQNKKLARKQVVYALNTLADWHLRYGRDPDTAKSALQEIIDRYPDSRASQSAESRIAHMADRATLEAADQPKAGKVMPKFERNLGLKGKTPDLIKPVDPNQVTDEYLAQLEEHPNDWDTRERLAAHYIEHYGNVACAVAELEILVRAKLAGKEDRCRWLHQIADWQAKINRDPVAAEETLKRIVEKYPGTAQAQRAEHAIQYLRKGRAAIPE